MGSVLESGLQGIYYRVTLTRVQEREEGSKMGQKKNWAEIQAQMTVAANPMWS